MTRLNYTSERRPRRQNKMSFALASVATAIATLVVAGCGYYGVDYGDSRDATTDDTKDQSRPGHTKSEDSTGGETKPGKPTRPPKDAGSGDPTITRDEDTKSRQDSESRATTDDSPDASVDAGPTPDDGGSATSRDAARDDSETSQTVPNPRVDGGNPVCAPNCDCAIGGDCELICLQSECAVTCASGTECDVLIGPAASVQLDCGSGAVCLATGVASSTVAVTCHGEGECETRCEDAQHCDVDCQGPGRCVTKCYEDATCDVTCAEGAECYVGFHELENARLTCRSGAVKTCDGYVTCNETCD